MNSFLSQTGVNFDDLLYILIAYVLGMLATILVGNTILYLAGVEAGTFLYLITSPLLAGVLEPVFSKLVPAIVVLYWAGNRREYLLHQTQSHPFIIGAYGGACVGIVEAFGKLAAQSGMYAGVNSVTSGVILAGLGHCLYGGIIGNAVYRKERSRWWQKPINATLVVILIHFSWNGYRVLELLNQIQ